MGRHRTVNRNLPPRMRARVRGSVTYYTYDAGGRPRREISLGTDFVLAVQRWAELHEAPPTTLITVGWAIGQYLTSPQFAEVSAGTQADYRFALDKLMRAFADAPLDQVKPSHVQLYIDKRSKESRHRALREKSVLSMIYGWAMARDFCTANPVAAIKTKRLPGRKAVYIEDDVLEAVYAAGSAALRDALDLAYLTGQRPADVLRMRETDIRDGHLTFRQEKTGQPMRIEVAGELKALVERMLDRKRRFAVRSLALLVDEHGEPMSKAKLRSRFEAARTAVGDAAANFQFRDLRRKAAADLRDQAGIEASQALLGHASVVMTEHYAAGKGRKISAIPRKPNVFKGSK
jgi:integrase